jgi:hypothetical protein
MQKTIKSGEAFSIISFIDNPSGSKAEKGILPYSVSRTYDGEIFTIGDLVTNGTKMKGQITGFSILGSTMFVDHTWSEVGMNLDSLSKIKELPSKHQVNDRVLFSINQKGNDVDYIVSSLEAEVKAVHFYTGKVKYDLEIPIAGETPTRIYNIDSCFVEPIS